MESRVRLSVSDKLLLAAWHLESELNKSPFSAEDLVVQAWRLFPETFGLSGYLNEHGKPFYPDSNRVFAEIMGSKPLRRMGLLQKAGQKMYILTESGREHARTVEVHLPGGQATGRATLSREAKAELHRFIASNAFSKFVSCRQDDITFHDACTFWAASPRSKAVVFSGRLSDVARLIRLALHVSTTGPVVLEHGRKQISQAELERLQMLQQYLSDRFESEVQTIMKRTDERIG